MNEWWWWLTLWGTPLGLCLLLFSTSGASDGRKGLALVLFFAAAVIFIIGLPIAAVWDLVTPCDGYGLRYDYDGSPVCVMQEGGTFRP